MIEKFRYHSGNIRHSENLKFSLCTVTFAMIANFRYHSEKLCIAKFTVLSMLHPAATVPLATVPTAPCFLLFLLYSAFLSS